VLKSKSKFYRISTSWRRVCIYNSFSDVQGSFANLLQLHPSSGLGLYRNQQATYNTVYLGAAMKPVDDISLFLDRHSHWGLYYCHATSALLLTLIMITVSPLRFVSPIGFAHSTLPAYGVRVQNSRPRLKRCRVLFLRLVQIKT